MNKLFFQLFGKLKCGFNYYFYLNYHYHIQNLSFHTSFLYFVFIKRNIFAAPKTIQATVTLLENLHVILEKTPRDDIRSEVLPLLFNAFENTIQVQVSQKRSKVGAKQCYYFKLDITRIKKRTQKVKLIT